jgi:hypothetical protein
MKVTGDTYHNRMTNETNGLNGRGYVGQKGST